MCRAIFREMLIFGVLAGATVSGVLLVARPFSGSKGSAAMLPGEISPGEAAQFDGYPLLWLGESFEGLPLTTVIRAVASDDPNSPTSTAQDGFYFIYGDCTPPPVDEGGCAPPLTVFVQPRCYNPPDVYGYVTSGTEAVRGGGQLQRGIPGGPILWTGGIAVSIFTSSDRLERVVAALVPLNAAAMGPAMRSVVADPADSQSALVAPPGGRCEKIQGRDRSKLPPIIGLNE